MYTDGLGSPPKSYWIEILDSHCTSQPRYANALGSTEIYPQPTILKQMASQNERINGWNNTYDS